MESEEMSTAKFNVCDVFDHLDDDWKLKAISDWYEKTGYFSNSGQGMEGPSEPENNGDYKEDWLERVLSEWDVENGNSVLNSGQGIKGPSELEKNGDSVLNSGQGMEGPSELQKNRDSVSNSRQDMEGPVELEKNGDSVSTSKQDMEGASELEKNRDSVSNSGQGMEGPSEWETNGDSGSNSGGQGKERPADLSSSVGSNVVPSSQHFPARLSEESRSPPSDSSDANDTQVRLSLMSTVTVKCAQHTVFESQGFATDVHQINHPNSNMESEEIPGDKLNFSESSDEDGDFVLKNRQNFEGSFRSVLSSVVPSSQHCPPRLPEEFRSPSSDFSDGSDNQLRSSSSDVNVISAQHAVFEIQQSAASDIYQITNPDTNMEEAIPSDMHNLFEDSQEDSLDKILADGERNGDFVINNCQGVEGPFDLQPDLSLVSSVVPSSQYFPAQLWKEMSSPGFFSFTGTDSDSQIQTSSSDMTVKPAQHTVWENHESLAAEVYQTNYSESNIEEDDMFNLSDDSPGDWLDKELAEGEKRGDFVSKFQQGVKGLFGLQLDFSGVSNVVPSPVPSRQHFPAQLCEEMKPPSFSSFPYTGNYSQIRTSWTDVTVDSAQHSVLESHKSKATEVYQINHPDSTMQEASPDDRFNLSNDSEEDWLDKELAEGEKNGDFVRRNRQGVEGPVGLQLDFSVVSNVLPSSQHLPARVSEFRSPISDFSGANICLRSEEAMNMDSPIATWDPKPSNTGEALGVVLGALPHLQSDFGGHSLPLITNIAFPPDNASPFHALPGSEPHVGCNSTDVGLQSPEAISLRSPVANTAKTWADYKKIEPKLHHSSRVMDPFETEKLRICKKQMKKIFNKKLDGLAQKLTAIVDNFKRCRDERNPIHIKVGCALEDDTPAITCCWSQTFGTCFPDDNEIMKTFSQVITRIVNLEIKARDNVATSDDVNKRCDEWFLSQLDVGPTRTDLKIRGKKRVEAINKLANSLKIPSDQVVRKWSDYRRRISRERLEAKRRTERLGLVDHRIETLGREITDMPS